MENDKDIKAHDVDVIATDPQKNNIVKKLFKGVGVGGLVAGGGILFILFSILQFLFTAIPGLLMLIWAINLFSKGSIIIGLLVLLIGTPLVIGLSNWLFPIYLVLAILSAIVWGIARIFGLSISFHNVWDLVWIILWVLILGALAFFGVAGFIEAIKRNRLLSFFKESWLGIIFFCFILWIFFH